MPMSQTIDNRFGMLRRAPDPRGPGTLCGRSPTPEAAGAAWSTQEMAKSREETENTSFGVIELEKQLF